MCIQIFQTHRLVDNDFRVVFEVDLEVIPTEVKVRTSHPLLLRIRVDQGSTSAAACGGGKANCLAFLNVIVLVLESGEFI